MILSHRHSFVFFKQMKSAGSSLELAMTPFCGPDDILTGSPYDGEKSLGYHERNNRLGYRPVWHQHTPPTEVLRNNLNIDKYFKFTTIRNPYDAVVSYFWWSFYSPDTTLTNHILKPDQHDGSKTLQDKFLTFLETYASFSKTGKQERIIDWFTSRYKLFYELPLDFIIRYEDLEVDFSMVCGMIGLGPLNIPKLKTDIRKSKYDYRVYYTNKSYDIVTNSFSDLISNFKYSFDN
tara:strand:+ start:3253 stop:3957 length:705 start_codon:yes stop_codon:yes gene_type:complete